MEAFFSQFPGFKYNASRKEESEFGRLRVSQGWEPTGITYKERRKEFLVAFVKETGAKLDAFFIIGYPNFDYIWTASPESQFERLARWYGWVETSDQYNQARKAFEDAYDEQFNTALDGFFNSYPDFDYNPRGEAKSEFERLREFKGWFGEKPNTDRYLSREIKLKKEMYQAARKQFFTAFVEDFSEFFGAGDNVRDWVYLCDVLKVKPTPRTIEHCKTALKYYYVNIYDLYDHVRHKSYLKYHDDVKSLSDYSIENNLLYPLDNAKTTCMKFLLRTFIGVRGYRFDDWSRSLVPRDSDY